MLLELRRFHSNPTYGLLVVGSHTFFTLELPWKDNQVRSSCIPVGGYKLSITESPKFGRVIYVHDVPGRSEILFHVGNKLSDTQGCILVGGALEIGSENPLTGSKKAFDRLLKIVSSEKSNALIISFPWAFTLETKGSE